MIQEPRSQSRYKAFQYMCIRIRSRVATLTCKENREKKIVIYIS